MCEWNLNEDGGNCKKNDLLNVEAGVVESEEVYPLSRRERLRAEIWEVAEIQSRALPTMIKKKCHSSG